ENTAAGVPISRLTVQFPLGHYTINVEGEMGTYGRVYVSYTLTARPDGKSGWFKGEGRGALEDGSFASGAGVGIYSREGTVFTMHSFVNMQDGTQNLDVVIFDAFTREVTHDVYVVQ
ncbi:MAG: hypothetical protein O3C15_07150, partial [Proteobacteria bacterium]|nr:hypothetical protein [Pseudomonadota bacterium]